MHPKIDFISGIVLMVFSVAAHRMADRLPPVPKGLGPGDYPKVIVTILFILGLILSGNAYYTARKKSWEGKKSYAKEEFKQVFLLVLCIAVYIKLVGYMGYLYLTPFFVFAIIPDREEIGALGFLVPIESDRDSLESFIDNVLQIALYLVRFQGGTHGEHSAADIHPHRVGNHMVPAGHHATDGHGIALVRIRHDRNVMKNKRESRAILSLFQRTGFEVFNIEIEGYAPGDISDFHG